MLIPDFQGDHRAIEIVMNAAPDVLNHNTETVPRLYRQVRLGARYQRSLDVLAYARRIAPRTPTKSGLMLGLGERIDEVLDVMRDLRDHNVDILTLGQYLRPSPREESEVPRVQRSCRVVRAVQWRQTARIRYASGFPFATVGERG